MTWTSPMTWVSNRVLTAAQLNTHLRDNLLETMPARASEAGQYFTSDARNNIEARKIIKNTVLTSDDTTDTEYTDLSAGIGPLCQFMSHGDFLVIFGGQMQNTVAGAICLASIEVQVNGETTVEPHDSYALAHADGANRGISSSHHIMFLDHEATKDLAFHTVTMKYRVTSGTGTINRRRMFVMPLS